MTAPLVVVHPDADVLAAAVAARLITALADAQAARGSASVVLTGGGVGTALLAQVAASPACGAVDWRQVDVWWGDERWVPADDTDRNDLGARRALLDHVDLDPQRIHPFAAEGTVPDPESAAALYAAELAAAAGPGRDVPAFDVLMLGVGPEGHVASLFPHTSASRAGGSVVAVHDCPKPPPTRISLTFDAITAARQVWLITAGEGKAAGVTAGLSGADRLDVPAAGAVGTDATLWLVDAAAAAGLA